MRIARYIHEEKECYGVMTGETVLCLPTLARRLRSLLPSRLEEFINLEKNHLKTAEYLLSKAAETDIESATTSINEVTIMAPIPFPPKIICLGLNYADHISEQDTKIPDEPIIFIKPRTAIIGPAQNIIKPSFVTQLDYEGELAIVVGKKAKNVPVAEAKSYIFGYTVFNDVSARDFQFKDGQWTRGKSFDTFAPTGPCILTQNQLRVSHGLSIRTWVNGELRQNSSTKNMLFNVNEIVYHLSRVMTLEPGDIIATGTPSGVGYHMKPKAFLQDGDIVKIEIEGIGILQNAVRQT